MSSSSSSSTIDPRDVDDRNDREVRFLAMNQDSDEEEVEEPSFNRPGIFPNRWEPPGPPLNRGPLPRYPNMVPRILRRRRRRRRVRNRNRGPPFPHNGNLHIPRIRVGIHMNQAIEHAGQPIRRVRLNVSRNILGFSHEARINMLAGIDMALRFQNWLRVPNRLPNQMGDEMYYDLDLLNFQNDQPRVPPEENAPFWYHHQ
ncbi:hypothetical protein KR009_002680 [Drosophila setifemur]|nr:hypothetical protein KR009_002680 [Drosophila setifemur]